MDHILSNKVMLLLKKAHSMALDYDIGSFGTRARGVVGQKTVASVQRCTRSAQVAWKPIIRKKVEDREVEDDQEAVSQVAD